MEIIKSEDNGVAILELKGRMDAVTSPEAEKALRELFDGGSAKLLIDLKNLEYISSAGLRVLLVAAKTIQQKSGKLALASLTDVVKEVFEISGFSSIFKLFASRDDALKYLKG